MVLKKCPLCGSRDLSIVNNEFKVLKKKKPVIISSVKRQKCGKCGEEFFDHMANSVLDEYRQPHNRRIKAA